MGQNRFVSTTPTSDQREVARYQLLQMEEKKRRDKLSNQVRVTSHCDLMCVVWHSSVYSGATV